MMDLLILHTRRVEAAGWPALGSWYAAQKMIKTEGPAVTLSTQLFYKYNCSAFLNYHKTSLNSTNSVFSTPLSLFQSA